MADRFIPCMPPRQKPEATTSFSQCSPTTADGAHAGALTHFQRRRVAPARRKVDAGWRDADGQGGAHRHACSVVGGRAQQHQALSGRHRGWLSRGWLRARSCSMRRGRAYLLTRSSGRRFERHRASRNPAPPSRCRPCSSRSTVVHRDGREPTGRPLLGLSRLGWQTPSPTTISILPVPALQV